MCYVKKISGMEVKFWTFLLVHVHLALCVGRAAEKSARHRRGDTSKEIKEEDKPLDFLTVPKTEPKDYFLPPVFTNEEIDEDDDDEDDQTYLDYDYDSKETNYKDSPDVTSVDGENQSIPVDDKIPLHTAKDNLPVFLLEPENTYVVKNKPATLKCRAANALEVYFKCNGIKTQALNFEFVDPQTGVRIIEGEHSVSKDQVEEYFGIDKYQCSCFAWTSRGQIRSQTATIEIAYIKKHFTLAPQSQLAKQYTPVTFRCEAPAAAPFAQLYWLKNGAPVVQDDNVQVSKEGSLVIKQASLMDMANYTCVAENLAGKRMSEPALLTVFVNGGWTAWSTWGDCFCPGQPHTEERGRRRIRSCTAPRPLNGGQSCAGPNVQKTQDCLECDLDVYVDSLNELADESSEVIMGRWSQWSDWSRCDSDCLQTRRRRCLSSAACLGKDYQVAQCPLCVRTSKTEHLHHAKSSDDDGDDDDDDYSDSNGVYRHTNLVRSVQRIWYAPYQIRACVGQSGEHLKKAKSTPEEGEEFAAIRIGSGSSYWPLLIALSVAFLIFLVVVILSVKYMKMKIAETSPYSKPMPGSNYFGSVMKRTLTNQPDVIHEEFHIDPRRQEHFYEVPQLAHSYVSPVDHEVRGELPAGACRDTAGSDHSDSSCFLSSGSSYGNDSIEMSPSLKNNASLDSKLNNPYLETATSKIVSGDGDWLRLEKCGVGLFIPDGVVEKGEELFSMEVCDEEWNKPILQEGETQLSPVIRCGPKNFHFPKGVILTFPHCAAVKNSSWTLSILQKPEELNTREWRKVLTLGQETPGTPIFTQVDQTKVYIVCEFLSDFVLVGRSFDGMDGKLLKVALFLSKRVDGYHNLHVRVFNDTPYAFHHCFETERRSNGFLLCDPKTMYFQENCSDLCINVRDVGAGWKIQSEGYRELSFSHVWNMNIRSLHCVFLLQRLEAINSLDLSVTIHQKQNQSNPVSFNLKTNDFNSHFNCNKRFSYSGVEMGYSINIFENPFNYSSLTKKEGRYDYVYRRDSHRSYTMDSTYYRSNVLTKSDRVILCKLLDGQSSKGNDWRMLAEKLKLSSFYYYFSNTCSPTENILNLWICRNNDVNMLVSLSRIFREMSRIDCATVVERRCFPN